jgi:hypothetical protein
MLYSRINLLKYKDIEQLTYNQLEIMIRSTTSNVPHNTYRKLNYRTTGELKGLNYNIMEVSTRNKEAFSDLSIEAPSRHNNTYSKLRERTTAEHEGLYYHVLEYSVRQNIANGKFKILRPTKNYKTNVLLIKKYFIKMEV